MEIGSVGAVSSAYSVYSAYSSNPARGRSGGGALADAAANGATNSATNGPKDASGKTNGKAGGTDVATGTNASDPAKAKNDSDQQAQIRKLEETDRKVRAHEQAHLAAAGGLAVSGASFQYTRGPDGKQYAVGGEVSIDVSEGRTPQETVDKASRIRAAALAPADPSAQDQAVAAAAAQMQLQAQVEAAKQRTEGNQTDNKQPGDASGRADKDSQAASGPSYVAQSAVAAYGAMDEPKGQGISFYA